MADTTIDSNLIVLYDNWPGAAMRGQDNPVDGFLGATHHNVATAQFRMGEKIQVYNAGTSPNVGFSTFIYLKYEGTGAPTSVIKQVVVPDSATVWFTVTNDPDSAINIPGGIMAVAISAMTDAYFGWFWCGGVCPEVYVPLFTGNFAGADSTLAGAVMAADLAADAIGFGPLAAATDVASGYILANAS